MDSGSDAQVVGDPSPPFAPAGLEATFVAGDPPRRSGLLLWRPTAAPAGLFPEALERVRFAGARERRCLLALPEPTEVSGVFVPWSGVIDLLAGGLDLGAVTDSVRFFAATVRAGLVLVARGRLTPAVSPEGWDMWRLDPEGEGERQLLDALAAALPPAAASAVLDTSPADPVPADPVPAHPVPAGPLTSGPADVVRGVWDGLADTFARPPAAVPLSASHLFAADEPTRVPHVAGWAERLVGARLAGAAVELRVHAPYEVISEIATGLPIGRIPTEDGKGWKPTLVESSDGPRWEVGFQLRSRRDPSVVMSAVDLWEQPEVAARRLGPEAEADLLVGLRRAVRIWPRLAAALDRGAPSEVWVDDDGLVELVDCTPDLESDGVRVLWPTELVTAPLSARATLSAPRSDGGPGRLTLETLLDVRWEVLFDGEKLTRSEVDQLAAAVLPAVRLRGRWVRTDPALLRRLRAGPPRVTVGEAVARLIVPENEGTDVRASDFQSLFPAEHGTDGAFGGPGETIPEASFLAEGEVAEFMAAITALRDEQEHPEPRGLNATLRPYQRRGLRWLVDVADLGVGGCLADDMGLGKTIQLIALHLARLDEPWGGDPTLVVCPTGLVTNWEREVRRFAPGVPVRRYHGGSRSLDGLEEGSVVITTYGVVRRDLAQLGCRNWGVVVADEAQHVKNPRSRAARALRGIPARARIATTGTPVENRLLDLWSLLDWTTPGLLGDEEGFRRDYAVRIERDRDATRAQRLASTVAPFLLRRRKSDPEIVPDLPPKVERDLVVPLTSEQAALYRASTTDLLDKITHSRGIDRRGLVLRLLTHLKQITNHPAHFLGQDGPLAGRSGKLEALEELVSEAADGGEQMLVFTQYVAMGQLLVAHLRARGSSVEMLHGGLSVRERGRLVDSFQEGGLEVLVCSLKAAGTGLNLTAATQVVHYDRWWNPAVEDQATDRAWRIGQTRSVQVHRLVTEGTVEDRVAELLTSKRELADRVVGGGESWIGELSDADLADLVRLDPRVAGGKRPEVRDPGSTDPGEGSDGGEGGRSRPEGGDR